jgi:hypothetical protein
MGLLREELGFIKPEALVLLGSEDYDRIRSLVVEDLGAAWQRAHADG